MKNLTCVHCNTPMKYLTNESIQLGKTGWFLGDLPNLVAGALEVDIYICPICKRLEFFASNDTPDDKFPQRTCPNCGTVHDFDYPKCPKCKHIYDK